MNQTGKSATGSATVSRVTNQPIESLNKEQLGTRKLLREVELLEKPHWRRPQVLLGVCTTLVAGIGVFGQCAYSRRELQLAEFERAEALEVKGEANARFERATILENETSDATESLVSEIDSLEDQARRVRKAGTLEDALAAVPHDPLLQGLVSYWKFDGDTANSLSNGPSLSEQNEVEFNDDGLFGQSLSFSRNPNSFLATSGDVTSLNFGVSPFTIQVWVKFKRLRGEQVLIEKWENNKSGWTLTKLPGRLIRFHCMVPGNGKFEADVMTLAAGVWHHIVVVRHSDEIRIFVDGRDRTVPRPRGVGGITSNNRRMSFGRRDVEGRFPLDGFLDEIAIWNRDLTRKDISKLWRAGAGRNMIIE